MYYFREIVPHKVSSLAFLIATFMIMHKSKKDTYEFYKIIEKMTHEI